MEFCQIIKNLRIDRGYTQQRLSSLLNVSKATIGMWETGKRLPSPEKYEEIADFFNVDIDYLYGRTSTMRQYTYSSDLYQIERKKFPLLGDVACGEPILCREERALYVEAGSDIDADFCVRAKGDSMVNARIIDGDIVFVRKQEMVENGEIAVVIIDDSTTLKRLFYYKDEGIVSLNAENPNYPPMIYRGEELNQIRIIGKAVAFQSDVK